MASEIRLVEQTVSRLSRRFCQKPRAKIINELLAGLLEEKRARQARNLDHWPEHGPKFLARLAKRWKVDEAKRLNRIAAVLKERRRDAARLALAITDNRTDAEVAVSDSDLDLLADAVKGTFPPKTNPSEMIAWNIERGRKWRRSDSSRSRSSRYCEKPRRWAASRTPATSTGSPT